MTPAEALAATARRAIKATGELIVSTARDSSERPTLTLAEVAAVRQWACDLLEYCDDIEPRT